MWWWGDVIGAVVAAAEGGMGKARPRGTAAVKTKHYPDPRDKYSEKMVLERNKNNLVEVEEFLFHSKTI